ncbi:MAG TPA: hypothetical protein VFY03_06595 [Woeseiaceae bacterium]|nr:hypothetical protein [Woeseiaceae bacterium]
MSTDFDDKVMADAARLARDIAPERDLWPGIEAALTRPADAARHAGDPRPGRAPWYAQAAAAVLLVAGSSLMTYVVVDREPVTVQQPAPAGLVLESASFGGQYELSGGYKLARTNVQAQMEHELRKLSPEARAEVEDNLAVIRGAIDEINAALAQEPNNVLLQDLLFKAYREELAVMRKVGGLTQDIMLRNDI